MFDAQLSAPSVAPACSTEAPPPAPMPCEVYSGWPSNVVGGPAKRAMDIVIAGLALIALAPVFALLALLIKADNGPVFFIQERIGLGGRRFRCIKFRSMTVNADVLLARRLSEDAAAAREWKLNRKLRNDPRVTPIGRFIRKLSLDELPQLINIVRGDMSIVGPRPVLDAELQAYGLVRFHYLRARPGLTGLWQVSGRSHTSYRQRVEFDRRYVNRWTLSGDIVIMLRTVPALLSGSGAM